MFLPCPGNGFSFFYDPWAISLISVFTLAGGIGMYVNVTRARALGSVQGGAGPPDRHRLLVILSLVASVLLASMFVWAWVQFFGFWGPLPWVTPVYHVLALFLHPLFILVSVAADRHLRRSR